MPYIPKIFLNQKGSDFQRFYLNTNTIYDLVFGSYIPTVSGYGLNGGLAPSMSGFVGKSATYKSTMTLSLAVRALSIYSDALMMVYDSEYALSKDRILSLYEPSITNIDKIEDRLVVKNKDDFLMDGLFEFIKDLSDDRRKHLKDILVETPFINSKTLKPLKTTIPLILVIDSVSFMQSIAEMNMFKDNELSDSKNNTIAMNDGKLKSLFLRQMPILCSKGNIHLLLTAHLREKIEMGPIKSAKTLQYLKYSDDVRGTGNGFISLTNNFSENRGVKVLLDGKKECQYPYKKSSSNSELSMIKAISARSKISEAGQQFDVISSQTKGILNNLSNYDYLINNLSNKGYGLDYKPSSSRVLLKPDVSLTRKSVREKFENDYELSRAIEILSQMCYIKNAWNTDSEQLNKLNTMTDIEICDKLLASNKPVIGDILNSRGYWTYDKNDKRDYMSVVDILAMI
jgi:hypothetical protein